MRGTAAILYLSCVRTCASAGESEDLRSHGGGVGQIHDTRVLLTTTLHRNCHVYLSTVHFTYVYHQVRDAITTRTEPEDVPQ